MRTRTPIRALATLTAGALAASSLAVLGAIAAPEAAQAATPVTCTTAGITVSANAAGDPSTVSRVNNTTGALEAVGTLNDNVNGIGYNVMDGLVYGVNSAGHLVRFGSDYGSGEEDLGLINWNISGVGTLQLLNGVVDDTNTMYFIVRNNNSNAWVSKVSLATGASRTATSTKITGTVPQIDDISFDPYGNSLYALTDSGMLKIDPTTAEATLALTTPAFNSPGAPNGRAGGSWSDSVGNMYFYQNLAAQHHLWKYAPSTATYTDMGAIAAASVFDATACLPPTMSKTVSPSSATVGDTLTFSFTISNPTNQATNAHAFADTLPSGLSWVAGSVTGVPASATASISGRTLSVSGNIPVPRARDGRTVITAQAKVGYTAAAGTNINQASVIYTTPTGDVTVTSDDPNQLGEKDGTPFTLVMPPLANDDTATTPQGKAVSIPVRTGDTARTSPIDPATITLYNPDGTAATNNTVAVDGEGTYTVVSNEVVFTPAGTFTGTVTKPAKYTVKDTAGRESNQATITPTVTAATGSAPTATPDAKDTAYNTAVSVSPLANDVPLRTNETADASSVKLLDPNNGNAPVTTLSIPNEGTYKVVDGVVTFAPLASFAGKTATAVTYTASTNFGAPLSSTITITVGKPAPPTTKSHADTTPQGVAKTVDVLADATTGGSAATIAASTLTLVDTANGNADVSKITIDGKGTYEVKDGKVVFTPVATFTGDPGAVSFRVKDSLGQWSNVSTVKVTVDPAPAPAPQADTKDTDWNTATTVNPLANDKTGSTVETFTPGSLVLVDPNGSGATRTTKKLVVANQGTYEVVVDGDGNDVVKFTPLDSFTGPATAVSYEVGTSFGRTTGSTITITVGAPPTPSAKANTDETPQNTPVTTKVLADDTDYAAARFDVTTLQIQDPATNAWGTKVTIPNEGVYETTADGQITFTPVATFTGEGTTIPYRVTDSLGRTASASLTDTVVAAPNPVAKPDSGTTPYDTAITLDVLNGDADGAGKDDTGATGATWVATSVKLLKNGDPAQPVTTLEVADEGTWTVGADGRVTFTPLDTFSGAATQVKYTASTTYGKSATTTIDVTVSAPAATVALPNSDSTPQGVKKTVDVLADDPFTPANPPKKGTLELKKTDGADTTWAKSVTIEGVGTYTVTADDTVEFAPLPTYTGAGVAVDYRVTDTLNRTVASTVVVSVDPAAAPKATADTPSTDWNTAVTLSPLANDDPAPESTSTAKGFVKNSLMLAGPNGPTRDAVYVQGVGTYSVNADDEVTFTPDASFTGTPDEGIGYSATTTFGEPISSTITPTVGIPPVATTKPNAQTIDQGTSVTVNVLGDDTATPAAPLDGSKLKLVDPADDVAKTKVVLDEGIYEVIDGDVVFTPAKTFSGTGTKLTYVTQDALGRDVSDTVQITVTPADAPAAVKDETSTDYDTPVSITPTANDTDLGSPYATWDTSKTVLLSRDATPVPTDRVEVAGQGVWTIENGVVTFTPDADFTGTADAVGYRATTNLGTTADSTIHVKVGRPGVPTASIDEKSGPFEKPIVFTPLSNDSTGVPAASWKLDTLSLTDPKTGDPVTEVTVADQGTWSVNRTTGEVTFTPVAGYVGTADAVAYTVETSFGDETGSRLVPTILAPPVAKADTAVTDPGRAVTVDVLDNDEATTSPLDTSTLVLLDAESKPVTRLETPQGVFEVVAGEIVFTPAQGFTGKAVASYQVEDENGVPTASTVTVTVKEPESTQDVVKVEAGRPVTIDPLANDTPGRTPFVRSTLRLLDPTTHAPVTRVDVPNVGVFSVNADGTVTFVPVAGFTGDYRIGYQVEDEAGVLSESVILIEGPDAVPAGSGSGAGGLAATGVSPIAGLTVSLSLLLAGALALLSLQLRRRRAEGDAAS
ncbi:Ig-like domain-containing protein [Schumannella sp. 10F1B-5-1]|uniref:Ig-like domain-containing protein n=1 Tax=Schumannella sp. 10F1B-5-1 TaxID=2590780 RepID=UPI0015E84D4F|nr:Ig-like domain-containing protein [Schumannella sp. 10F1B-5-1]